MIFFVLLLPQSIFGIDYPKSLKVESGQYSGFIKILQIVPAIFNQQSLFGYAVNSDFDIATLLATELKSKMNMKVNLTDMIIGAISDYVDQKPSNESSDIISDLKSINYSSIIDRETSDYIGYAIGVGFMCIFLLIFLVLSIVYFLCFCFCCCCCWTREDSNKPTSSEMVYFYVSTALLAVSFIFMYISSFSINNIIKTFEELPEFMGDIGPVLCNILDNVNNSMSRFGESVSYGGVEIVDTLEESFLYEGLFEYIKEQIEKVRGTIICEENYTSGNFCMTYTLQVSDEKDSNFENTPTIRYAFDSLIGNISCMFGSEFSSNFSSGFNITEIIENITEAANIDIDSYLTNITYQVGNATEPTKLEISSVKDYFIMEKYVSEDLTEQLKSGSFLGTKVSDFNVTLIDIIEKYKKHSLHVKLILFLCPIFFALIILIRVLTFHSNNSCGCFISSFSVVYPSLSLLLNFSFGVVFTFLSLVLIIANTVIYQTADDIVDHFIDMTYRQVYVPKLTFFNKYLSSYTYLEDASTDPFTLEFAEETTPIKYLVDAEWDSDLDEVFGVSSFLQLTTLVEYIKGKVERLLSANQIGKLLQDLVGKDISEQIKEIKIPDITFDYVPLRTIAELLGFNDTGESSCSSDDSSTVFSTTSNTDTCLPCSKYEYLEMVKNYTEEKKNSSGYCTSYYSTDGSNCSKCYDVIVLAYYLNESYRLLEEGYLNNTIETLNNFTAKFENLTTVYSENLEGKLNSSIPDAAQVFMKNVTDALSNVFQSVDIQTVRGPFAYALNVVYYISVTSNCICIICHFVIIGLFINTCSLCQRRKGMYSRKQLNITDEKKNCTSPDSAFEDVKIEGTNEVKKGIFINKKPLSTDSLKSLLIEEFYVENGQ